MQIETNELIWDEGPSSHASFRTWHPQGDPRYRIVLDTKYSTYTPSFTEDEILPRVQGLGYRTFAAAEAEIKGWMDQLPAPTPAPVKRTSTGVIRERWAYVGLAVVIIGMLGWAWSLIPA